MAKPAVVFPDPMLATLTVLRALAPSEATYGTKQPEEFPADNVPTPPYAMVRTDFQQTAYPVLQTATIRVTVWGASEASGLALAGRLMAYLLSYAGDTEVRGFGDLTGPLPTTDPDTGRPISTFTVAARLRPAPLI
jgi:predicted small lipoprotein YifL